MKLRKFNFLFIFIISILFIQGCRKYNDGPTLSFLSKKARVVGKWHTGLWLVDKQEETLMIDTNRRAEFSKDWKYHYHEYNPMSKEVKDMVGTWAFRDEKGQLLLGLPTGNNNSMNYELWDILMLKNKELWLELIVYGFPNSTIYEWRLRLD